MHFWCCLPNANSTWPLVGLDYGSGPWKGVSDSCLSEATEAGMQFLPHSPTS